MCETKIGLTLDKLLKESSYQNLYANTTRAFGTDRKFNSVRAQVENINFIPTQDSLIVKAVTRTEQGLNYKYVTQIEFEDVSFLNEDDENAVELTSAGGNKIYIKQLDALNTNVKVSCGCLDFYYRFAVWNQKDNSLLGNPPKPYTKKTEKQPVNPSRSPGVCKHIMAVADQLRSENILSK